MALVYQLDYHLAGVRFNRWNKLIFVDCHCCICSVMISVLAFLPAIVGVVPILDLLGS